MFKKGHMGLTAGMSSIAAASWVRKRVQEDIVTKIHHRTITERVRHRGRYAIASLAFVSSSVGTSVSVDGAEHAIDGMQKRRDLHSIPVLSGVWKTAKFAKKYAFWAVKWVADQLGIMERLEPIVEALEDLTDWVLNGGFMGAITHVIGDVVNPAIGFGRLRGIWPISKQPINVDVSKLPHVERVPEAGNAALNTVSYQAGVASSAVAWSVITAHILTPRLPETDVKAALKRAKKEGMELFDDAIDTIERLMDYLRDGGDDDGFGSAFPR